MEIFFQSPEKFLEFYCPLIRQTWQTTVKVLWWLSIKECQDKGIYKGQRRLFRLAFVNELYYFSWEDSP